MTSEANSSRRPTITDVRDLCAAASSGSVRKVQKLVAEGIPANSFHVDAGYPLNHAFDARKLNTVTALLRLGADPNFRDYIRECVNDDLIKFARVLIESGASPDGRPTWEEDGGFETNLLFAIRKGNLRLVKLLLDAGADPGFEDADGISPVLEARRIGSRSIEQSVVAHATPEMLAASSREIERERSQAKFLDDCIKRAIAREETDVLLHLLKKRKSSANAPLVSGGGTPLDYALNHYFEVASNEAMMRPLDEPRCSCHDADGAVSIMISLLGVGADPAIGTSLTTLHGACRLIHPRPALYADILSRSSNINCRDSGGGTPLMYAAYWASGKAVEALLAAGADAEIRDSRNESALDIVERMSKYRDYSAIIGLLED